MDRFDRAGQAFAELCRLMAKLRAPGGCPWDRKQTLDTLKPYLIEETYETLDAIEHGQPESHCEELGDLLLQIVFQAELRQEQGHFDVAEVVKALCDKLVRRHPHVFGESKVSTAEAALKSWEGVKANERAADESVLDGVPRALPALLRALRSGEKAAGLGFDWPNAAGVRAKVEEEWRELWEALDQPSAADRHASELGDLLFAIANLARHLSIDPEAALRSATDRFGRRFRHVEQELKRRERPHGTATLEEMETLWEEAKSLERSGTLA